MADDRLYPHPRLHDLFTILPENTTPSLQLAIKAAVNLSGEQVRQYHKAGFLVLRDVLPRDAIEAVISHKLERMLPWVLYPAEYAINTLLKQVTAQVSGSRASKGWNSVFGFFNGRKEGPALDHLILDVAHLRCPPASNSCLTDIPLKDSFWAEYDFFYAFWSSTPMAGLVGQLFPEASGIRLLADLYVGFLRKDVPVVLVSSTRLPMHGRPCSSVRLDPG